jgi:antirestriction protein
MNTEKIEKLKKSLSNPKIPADLKPKIEAEIKRLEDLDAKQSEPKEEENPVAEKTTTRKPRATKSTAKKTSTRKPSQTSKPKRTAMSVAKEIRKDGESWKDAMARASKMMKEKTHTATKDVESELDKLTKLVRSKKELKGQVYKTDLLRDAKRKAKPRGARKVTRSGETSNQYGTYKNHLGRKYYESRDEHSDRLAPRYPKNAPLLAEGGYLTDPTFGNFQSQVFAKGGGVRTINGREYSYGRNWTNDHNLTNKGEEHEVNYTRKKRFELGGTVVTDLAGHTGGSLGGDPTMLDGMSGTSYTGLVGETGAMSSGEMFMNGGGLPSGANQSYMITEAFGNPAQHFAKGGGVRRVGNREYSYGRNWTNDHEHTNKGEEHEVKYTRKGKFLGIFNDGGKVGKWIGYDKDHLMNTETGMIVLRGTDLKDIKPKDIKGYDMLDNQGYAKGGGVRRVGNREYSLGRNWTNDHEHVNKAEEHETKYTRKKSFAGGGGVGETPKIYVADLEAYNNGRLSGVWLDLADYNDADELMEAIQDFLNTTGGEEYAIHDAEYIPSSMYSEYMGQRDFEELYEMIDLAKDNNLPLSVVQEVVSQYDASAVEEFQGKYDDAEDFAEQMADEIGFENFSSPEYYVYITDTDRRLLAGEMADSYVDDIRDEDGGNRVIEEAGMDVSEYEEADSDRQEEMLDEAVEIVRDEYYDNWYEGLSDPYYFLVEEQGMYSPDDFFNASFISIDYEKLGRDLEQDYTFIYDDGELYVFNIR